jgi:iron complex transport system permease protein
MLIGGDNKFVLPASMLIGSFLLLVSDLIARVVIYPDELRAGLIMSIIGAPIFLYIIVSRKSNYGSVY